MNQKDPEPLPAFETPEQQEQRFREELDIALIEADDPNCEWIPHEVVVEQMLRELAELDALIAAGHTNATHLESQREEVAPKGDAVHREKKQ